MPAAAAKRVMMLTSPLMRGPDVERLQTDLKLAGHLQDTVDSEFGPLTAQAVYRAKYWLGYKTPDHSAESGGLLVRLLEGKSQPSDTMVRLAARRKKALSAKPIGAKMLDEAFKWIGTKESPANSNNVIFSRKYGIRGPWCAMFVSCMGVTVGSK